jgi:succinate dehydrogenase / fumarate reductase membrane anchor subunit
MTVPRTVASLTAPRTEAALRHVRDPQDGLGDCRLQRWTALALVPLGLYYALLILNRTMLDQPTAASLLPSPLDALMLVLFVCAVLTHAAVGLRSVVADYARTGYRVVLADLLVRAIAVVLGTVSVLAVLKLYVGR